MFVALHKKNKLQLWLGLLAGIIFGFLLQKGGVTQFDVILSQLMLKDWRIIKVMFTAIISGSLGVHLLVSLKLARLHTKNGSVGMTVIGGIIFGLGFAILGYCPGIVPGAIGQGSLDALFAGLTGILIGTGIFVNLYPVLEPKVLKWGAWKSQTFPEMFNVNYWVIAVVVCLVLGFCLFLLEIYKL